MEVFDWGSLGPRMSTDDTMPKIFLLLLCVMRLLGVLIPSLFSSLISPHGNHIPYFFSLFAQANAWLVSDSFSGSVVPC